MNKKFDQWNLKKKAINTQQAKIFYHEREIWWCSLGVNIGAEQDGTGRNYDRPVLIIKGFNRQSLLAIPLTGKKKLGHYYFVLGNVEGREATAIISQIRLVDSRRLIKKMMTVDSALFKKLKTAIAAVLLN